MKKVILKKKPIDNCYDIPNNEISTDGRTYPPLFCRHTWTKSVPICVIYLKLLNLNKMLFYKKKIYLIA